MIPKWPCPYYTEKDFHINPKISFNYLKPNNHCTLYDIFNLKYYLICPFAKHPCILPHPTSTKTLESYINHKIFPKLHSTPFFWIATLYNEFLLLTIISSNLLPFLLMKINFQPDELRSNFILFIEFYFYNKCYKYILFSIYTGNFKTNLIFNNCVNLKLHTSICQMFWFSSKLFLVNRNVNFRYKGEHKKVMIILTCTNFSYTVYHINFLEYIKSIIIEI